MSKPLIMFLAFIAIAIVITLLRRKKTITGTIVGKRVSMDQSGDSIITVKTTQGERFNLIFDTYARIGCKHFRFRGTSECFHNVDIKEFDARMNFNAHITASIDSVGDEPNILFVHKVISIT